MLPWRSCVSHNASLQKNIENNRRPLPLFSLLFFLHGAIFSGLFALPVVNRWRVQDHLAYVNGGPDSRSCQGITISKSDIYRKIGTATIFLTRRLLLLYIVFMPRIARAVTVGYPHHITQMGNYRQAVFESDEDYLRYLECLSL